MGTIASDDTIGTTDKGSIDSNTLVRETVRTLTWKDPVILFSSLLPLMPLIELVLGAVSPKTRVFTAHSQVSGEFHSSLQCPQCGERHDYLKWYARNATVFGNWFGYYCNRCTSIIPCERTLISRAILLLTYPVRAPFVKPAERLWLRWQQRRFHDESPSVSQHGFGPLVYHFLFSLNLSLLTIYPARIPFDALYSVVRPTVRAGLTGYSLLDALFTATVITVTVRVVGRFRSLRPFGFARMTPMDGASTRPSTFYRPR